MPVVATEIMFVSKILANGMVILVAARLSLMFVVQWWLEVPVAGSAPPFLGGSSFYVFTVARLAFFSARSQPQWPSLVCWRFRCYWS